MRLAILIAAVIAAQGFAASAAQPRRSAALTKLAECRSIAEAAARLACFDRETAALEAAQASGAVVIVEREEIRSTRRKLFGLTLPNLSVFGDDTPGAEGISQIESKIRRISRNPYGKWIFELEDGARWAQIDTRELSRTPRVGDSIKIRRATMGSYLANVQGQIAIGVERVR
ncbi:MAG TPA: hypothetical protein VF662_06465 [Allosphingosinicella sp.]|jgi:hypothetical protein